MKSLLALFCLLLPLIATRVEAANAWNERDLDWIAPTKCSDGSPIAQCPVTGYRVEAAGDCAATRWNPVVDVTTTSFHVTRLAAGTYCFRVIATSANGDSGPSPITDKSRTTVTAPASCPPQPAPETRAQACVAPLVGNWSQTRTPQAVEPPACWAMGAWTPDTAPDGVCASPPPPSLTTADTRAYEQRSATTPLALIGVVRIGQPCGPETLVRNGVTYCRVALWSATGVPQVLPVVWMQNLAGTDYWVKAVSK